VDAIKEYRHIAGYQHEFGDAKSFRQGYRQGFRAAYGDAFRGIPYRGINQVREAAQGHSLTADWKEFDKAASTGYDAGYATAQHDSMPPSAVQQASEHCPASHYNHDYCEGFSRGYRLGYSDGFVDQQSHLAQAVRAGAAESQ
jgi:flagellar biosynthesis/type III secretory pathway protein FliH